MLASGLYHKSLPSIIALPVAADTPKQRAEPGCAGAAQDGLDISSAETMLMAVEQFRRLKKLCQASAARWGRACPGSPVTLPVPGGAATGTNVLHC